MFSSDNDNSKFWHWIQIFSGIICQRIRYLNTQHPAQKPITASNVANKVSILNNQTVKSQNPERAVQSAEDEKITPIPCANLLGAPMVVLRRFPSAGIIPFVANNPIGLKVGPVIS